MPIAVIVEVAAEEGQDPRDVYDRVIREVNNGEPMTHTSQWNDGLISHVPCVGEDGSSVAVDLWQDEDSMKRSYEKLRPVSEGIAGAQYEMRVMQMYNLVTER
jgi:hypothetical protein